MNCGCKKLAYKNTIWCESCYSRVSSNFQQLYLTLSKLHRGAGGAAMCICGAGCGGTQECSALSLLKAALQTEDQVFKDSVLQVAGWTNL